LSCADDPGLACDARSGSGLRDITTNQQMRVADVRKAAKKRKHVPI
jgi:hypothetical protein